MRITIERLSTDKLNRQVWEFNFNVDYSKYQIRLVNYAEQKRETTRHKFKDEHGRTYGSRDYRQLSREEVPLPEDVIHAVKISIITAVEQLTVI